MCNDFATTGIGDALPVPVHGNRPLKRGTLNNILRTAGLSRDDLRRLLGS